MVGGRVDDSVIRCKIKSDLPMSLYVRSWLGFIFHLEDDMKNMVQ